MLWGWRAKTCIPLILIYFVYIALTIEDFKLEGILGSLLILFVVLWYSGSSANSAKAKHWLVFQKQKAESPGRSTGKLYIDL